MAFQKCIPLGDASSVGVRTTSFSSKMQGNAQLVDLGMRHMKETDVNVDLTEVYFLIMHFLSAGPCQRTCGQLWNELLEHQLLPRRCHAWYSRSREHSGDENDDGVSFPLNYSQLVVRYPHIDKDHLVKLLKQLLLNTASTSQAMPNAAHVPTLLGMGSFSLLSHDKDNRIVQEKLPPAHMRWPHMHADQVRGLSLREIGGGFARHHRAPSNRAACYAIAKPSTLVQRMGNIKKLRGHRNAVYCAIFDRYGRYVITGSDDRLVKIWSMETAFCLASCRGHEGDITDLSVSFNNAVVASASNDYVIRVWRLPDGLPVSVLRGHTAAVTAIAFCPRPGSLHQLLSSSDDGTCRIWDARSSHIGPRVFVPRPADSLAGKNGAPATSIGPQSQHQIFCCAFNSSGTIFVTGSSDNLARVWNACKPSTDESDQPSHEIDVLVGHENDVNYVQFSGCAVASRLSLTDSTKEESVPKLRTSLYSHDNIVTCSRDGSATIWTPKSRRSHGKVGRWTRLYHLKVPAPPMPPQPPRGPRQRSLPTPRGVNMIVWSLDNRFVLAAIMDCRICVWNAADSSIVHTLTGHTASTYVLDVHPFNPRIAMSAGYDGKTIVWDIWEGKPIQIYEISRFKLVDGKFSPDGTSIILSDDVGQLYILSTGQGESQRDAKYDQFFLGDYRPLIQDTYGNVLDQETQLMPYRRNLQDLLCDSGMHPYEEPYQSMYQKRRLGALGMEWKPSSLKLATGPDFSLDPDYQMLPLADLDFFVEPLPEFVDAMDWEPEIEVRSDDTDSEYNVPEEYSSGGEHESLKSSSSDDLECSAEESEVEINDGFRRSKRKKQKAEAELMTSSGRRVKRRNLDEPDGNSFGSHRSRNNIKTGRKSSKRRSSSSKALRPQRAAARNALNLFSKITGTGTDGEDDDGSECDSETESSLQDSNIESDELDEYQQKEQSRLSKGKEVVVEESFDVIKPQGPADSHIGNRKRLILKLPVRDSNKIVIKGSALHKDDDAVKKVGSSLKTAQEATDANGIHVESSILGYCSDDATYGPVEQKGGQIDNNLLDLSKEYKSGDIRWGGVKARTPKRQKLGGGMSSAAYNSSTFYLGHDKERDGDLNDLGNGKGQTSLSPSLEVQNHADAMNEVPTRNVGNHPRDISEVEDDVANAKKHPNPSFARCADSVAALNLDLLADQNEIPVIQDSAAPAPTRFRIMSRNISRVLLENHTSGGCKNFLDYPEEVKEEQHVHDISNGHYLANNGDGLKEPDGQVGEPLPHLNGTTGSNANSKRMFNVVYRRLKGRANLERDDTPRESTSNSVNHDSNIRGKSDEGLIDRAGGSNSIGFRASTRGHSTPISNGNPILQERSESDDKILNVHSGLNGSQLPSEDWGSSSRPTVGLRSSRQRRSSYHLRDTSPVNWIKVHQPAKGGSWLMLTKHEEGPRYIPQLGDEVAYLRQGHQEYLKSPYSKQVGRCTLVRGDMRAVEFCKVVGLTYATLPGSGDSCCKLTLEFVDPNSSVFKQKFNLTLPEVTGFPDFLVERTRFEASMQRKWACRDKCKVWWKNEGEEDGDWWDGRVICTDNKSPEFPDSPWERYTVSYKSDPKERHRHSPWEFFDTDSQWEQPHIDDEIRSKLLSALEKLERSASKPKDQYGVQKLRQVSQKSNFVNRFAVPLSFDVIRARVENSYYRSLEGVKHDIEIMFSNAESYFEKNEELLAKIRRLSDWFERTILSS